MFNVSVVCCAAANCDHEVPAPLGGRGAQGTGHEPGSQRVTVLHHQVDKGPFRYN